MEVRGGAGLHILSCLERAGFASSGEGAEPMPRGLQLVMDITQKYFSPHIVSTRLDPLKARVGSSVLFALKSISFIESHGQLIQKPAPNPGSLLPHGKIVFDSGKEFDYWVGSHTINKQGPKGSAALPWDTHDDCSGHSSSRAQKKNGPVQPRSSTKFATRLLVASTRMLRMNW